MEEVNTGNETVRKTDFVTILVDVVVCLLVMILAVFLVKFLLRMVDVEMRKSTTVAENQLYTFGELDSAFTEDLKVEGNFCVGYRFHVSYNENERYDENYNYLSHRMKLEIVTDQSETIGKASIDYYNGDSDVRVIVYRVGKKLKAIAYVDGRKQTLKLKADADLTENMCIRLYGENMEMSDLSILDYGKLRLNPDISQAIGSILILVVVYMALGTVVVVVKQIQVNFFNKHGKKAFGMLSSMFFVLGLGNVALLYIGRFAPDLYVAINENMGELIGLQFPDGGLTNGGTVLWIAVAASIVIAGVILIIKCISTNPIQIVPLILLMLFSGVIMDGLVFGAVVIFTAMAKKILELVFFFGAIGICIASANASPDSPAKEEAEKYSGRVYGEDYATNYYAHAGAFDSLIIDDGRGNSITAHKTDMTDGFGRTVYEDDHGNTYTKEKE